MNAVVSPKKIEKITDLFRLCLCSERDFQETERLHIKLDQCAQAALEQMKMAEKNATEAMIQNQRAEEALKKASKK